MLYVHSDVSNISVWAAVFVRWRVLWGVVWRGQSVCVIHPLIYIYNWIACGVCSIIVWFADNVQPSLCSTSACAVQIKWGSGTWYPLDVAPGDETEHIIAQACKMARKTSTPMQIMCNEKK